MILDFPKWMKGTPMIELGSYSGDSTQLFWLFFDPVIAVEPHCWFTSPHKSNEEVGALFRQNTEWRGIQHLKCYSNQAFEDPTYRIRLPGWVSCVYIDANHSYECARRDILNAWPSICDGGYICGHDYGLTSPEAIASKQDGVKQAVDEVFGEPDRLYEDTSWCVQKKEGRKLI
jgi:hypothetical protein